jgi:hypothetical protein
MGRDDNTTEELAVLATRLSSAVDFLISVAKNSGLSGIAARLEAVHRDLEPLLREPEGENKPVKERKISNEDKI